MVKNSKIILTATLVVLMVSCYSFKGGSIPEHLKTINILNVEDNSGFGNPQYKITLTDNLIDEFNRDNSLKIVNNSGDSELKATILSIQEQAASVSQSELESERKVTVKCKVSYYDNVKRKEIWNKNFDSFDVFDINNISAERDEAINNSLERIAEDILFAVVSGW